MKKFSYRMENVLNIKIQLENQQKIAFAIANNELNDEKEKLVVLNTRKHGYEQLFSNLLDDRLDILQIKAARNAIEVMKSAIRDQTFRVAKAEKKVEFERQKLNEIRMDRKTHEKLKEYAFDAYKKEFAREEMREIDQTVTYKYSAK